MCQLKSWNYEYLDSRYVISVKIISISKSIWSTILLFPHEFVLKAHLTCILAYRKTGRKTHQSKIQKNKKTSFVFVFCLTSDKTINLKYAFLDLKSMSIKF